MAHGSRLLAALVLVAGCSDRPVTASSALDGGRSTPGDRAVAPRGDDLAEVTARLCEGPAPRALIDGREAAISSAVGEIAAVAGPCMVNEDGEGYCAEGYAIRSVRFEFELDLDGERSTLLTSIEALNVPFPLVLDSASTRLDFALAFHDCRPASACPAQLEIEGGDVGVRLEASADTDAEPFLRGVRYRVCLSVTSSSGEPFRTLQLYSPETANGWFDR